MISYIKIGDSVKNDDVVEVPTETDGTLLLSSVCAQFPGSAGLRFKSESGIWRGLRCSGNIIDPPPDGWGEKNYYVVKQAPKRAAVTTNGAPSLKLSKETEENSENIFLEKFHVPDLMIADVPYRATDEEVSEYFEHFGGLDQFSIKRNEKGESRGFGFIKFKTPGATKAVLNMDHFIHNRRLDIRYTKRALEMLQMGYGLECMPHDNIPTKLYIGRMPTNTTSVELQQTFMKYAPLRDVYIPQNSNGRFGFVTFSSVASAFRAMSDTHQIKGQYLQLRTATNNKPKPAGDGSTNSTECTDGPMDEFNRPSRKVGDAKQWKMTSFLMDAMNKMSADQREAQNKDSNQQQKPVGLSVNSMNKLNKSNNQGNTRITQGTNQNSTNNESNNINYQNSFSNGNYGGGYGSGYGNANAGGYGGYSSGGYGSSGFGYGYGNEGYGFGGYGSGHHGSSGYNHGNGYGENYNSLGGNPVWGKPQP